MALVDIVCLQQLGRPVGRRQPLRGVPQSRPVDGRCQQSPATGGYPCITLCDSDSNVVILKQAAAPPPPPRVFTPPPFVPPPTLPPFIPPPTLLPPLILPTSPRLPPAHRRPKIGGAVVRSPSRVFIAATPPPPPERFMRKQFINLKFYALHSTKRTATD